MKGNNKEYKNTKDNDSGHATVAIRYLCKVSVRPTINKKGGKKKLNNERKDATTNKAIFQTLES